MHTRQLASLETTGRRAYQSLFRKAHTLIWDIDRDIPWGEGIDPMDSLVDPASLWCHASPTWQGLEPEQKALVAREDTKHTVRLLSVGETVAQEICAKQTLLFEREDWRNHASAQAMDEARHHQVYERFLDACGGERYYISPGLERMFDAAIDSTDATQLTLREQLILESVGFGMFARLARYATNPALKRIFELVLRDESRHIAFGMHYIKEHIAGLDRDAKIAFAREAFDYVNMFNSSNEPTYIGFLRIAGVDDPEGTRAKILHEMNQYYMLRSMEIVSGQQEPDWEDSFVRLFMNLNYVGLLDQDILDELGDAYPQIVPYANLVTRKGAPEATPDALVIN